MSRAERNRCRTLQPGWHDAAAGKQIPPDRPTRGAGCGPGEAIVDLDIGADLVTVHLRGTLGARSAAALRVVFTELDRAVSIIHVHTSQATSLTREVLAVLAEAQLRRRDLGLPHLQVCPVGNQVHDLMPAPWEREPAAPQPYYPAMLERAARPRPTVPS